MLKTIVTAAVLTAIAVPALASEEPACGNAARDQWMSEDAIKAKGMEMGYDVRRVKIEGNCYELYAKDKDGRRVEAYLNPVTGDLVKTKVED